MSETRCEPIRPVLIVAGAVLLVALILGAVIVVPVVVAAVVGGMTEPRPSVRQNPGTGVPEKLTSVHAEMRCRYGASIEATYASEDLLLKATIPRVIRFGAAGPVMLLALIRESLPSEYRGPHGTPPYQVTSSVG